MIEKLASFITKRYKLIIAIWIVALIIAVPFVPKLSQVLVYDETQMAPPDVESMSAQDFINENFGNAEAVPGTILVLESPESITDPESLALIYSIQDQLYRTYGSDVTVTSVYTPLQEILLMMNGVYNQVIGQQPALKNYPEQVAQIVLAQLMDAGVIPPDLTQDQKEGLIGVIIKAGNLGVSPDQIIVLETANEVLSDPKLGGINGLLDMFPVLGDSLSLLVSENGKITMMTFSYGEKGSATAEQLSELREIVNGAAEGTSIQHWITGSDPLGSDLEESTMSDLRIIEPVTIVLVLVLIGLFFRSLLGAVMPPLSVGIALGISFSLVYLLSFVMQIHYSVQTLMLTGMMGAGCDYCIFILSRYREERKAGRDKESSVRESVMWAGESIATSGATVIIGFGALAIANFSMLQSMGIALALGVLIALLVALTLIPSLLMLLGDKLFWPAKFGKPSDPETFKKRFMKKKDKEGYFARSAKFAIKHAKVMVVVMILISVPAIYLVTEMDQSYDFVGAMAETESTEGLAVLGEGFGAGVIQPTQIAIEFNEPVLSGKNDAIGEATDLAEMLADMDGVASVTDVQQQLENGTIESILSNDGNSLLLTVVFQNDPYDETSMNALNDMREINPEEQGWTSMNAVYVGGSTALMYDISQLVQNDMNTVEIVVVIAIYLVLLFVLGAVISPLRSIITILLSISWTLAVMVLLFQYGLGQDILWIVPMVLLVVCLGLGMDYDILLTTRIREEIAKGKSNNDAIVYSVEKTGGIITACGFIMAAAFGSMMLSSGYLLKEFGFALMFAILLDAMFVRIYLVPAIMSLLGKWNWWAPAPIAKMYKKRNARRMKNVQASQDYLSSWQRKPEE